MSETTDGTATDEVEVDSEKGMDKWDDHYDNPKSNLILISSDRVGFRVDTWTFGKQSQFVKDLLECPSSEGLDNAPVAINHEANIIRHFLDLFQPSIATVPSLSVSSYAQLIDLCHLFQAPMVYDVVTTAILVRLDDGPVNAKFAWDVYKLAAQLDDLELAKAADGKLHRPDKLLIEGPTSNFDEIPAKYLHALLRSALRWKENLALRKENGLQCWTSVTPEVAASNFMLS